MTSAPHLSDCIEYPPQRVLQAMLAVDLMTFIEYTFGVVRPDVIFKPNWHIEALAHALSRVASGESRRLIITLPPRNLKSICASVALPAWFLGHHPSERVVAVSYYVSLARIHASDFLTVVTVPHYLQSFRSMY